MAEVRSKFLQKPLINVRCRLNASRLGLFRWPTMVRVNSRIAVYGLACTVMSQGSAGERRPYGVTFIDREIDCITEGRVIS